MMNYTPTLTVKELIEQLSKLDQDLPVWLEGCDCLGRAGSVTVEDGSVLIKLTVLVD